MHAWAELKKVELSRAQKAKADNEIKSLSPFRLSNRSKKILLQKDKKTEETNKKINEFKETVVPYWPNKNLEM